MAAAKSLHRIEGLAVLDQVHPEPLDNGYPGAWWRQGQILLGHGRQAEAWWGAEEALKFDPRYCGARQLMESL